MEKIKSGGGFAIGANIPALTKNQIAFGSSSNTITSSSNFIYDPIGNKFFVGFGSASNNTSLNILDDVSQVIASGNKSITKSNTIFTGSGLNDLTATSTFTGITDTIYTVTIDGTGTPDTFTWTDGTTTVHNVPITGSAQNLNDDVIITFGATTGHTLGNSWSWKYTLAFGMLMLLDGQNNFCELGDISNIGFGTTLFVDDKNECISTASKFVVNTGRGTSPLAVMQQNTAGASVITYSADNTVAIAIETSSDGSLDALHYIQNGNLYVKAEISGEVENIQTFQDDSGYISLVDIISTPAYGTTVDISATETTIRVYDYQFTGGSGASGLLLPIGTNAVIGTVVVVGDLDGVASTNNITIDAGTGNTINGVTIAQTFILNQNGQCVTIKKVTAAEWKIEGNSI